MKKKKKKKNFCAQTLFRKFVCAVTGSGISEHVGVMKSEAPIVVAVVGSCGLEMEQTARLGSCDT